MGKMIAPAFLIMISLFAQISPGALGEMAGADLKVRYETSLRPAAEEVLKKFPSVKSEVEKKIGWDEEAAPTIVLLRGGGEVARYAGSNLVTAFAVPGRNLIVIDYSKMKSPFDLDATMKHELTHLLLGGASHPRFPKWFDEGVAQWASGGIADIINPGGEDLLRRAVLAGKLIDISDLDLNFPQESEKLLLAYQEGKSLVEYIGKEYGDRKLRSLLAKVNSGTEFEPAVLYVLSTDLGSIEQNWRRYLKRRYAWPAYVADNIYLIVFLIAAVATLAGYLRFRKRLRTYRDEEDEEDGDVPGP